MITRHHFATATEGARSEATHFGGAPTDARPVRVTLGTVLPPPDLVARHPAIVTAWFDDVAHADRFEAWFATAGVEVAGPVVRAESVVVRGDEWLDRRWADGGTRYQHVSLATRAAGLRAEEFSRQWRDHAGRARPAGSATATAVPDAARGCAYVQAHPCSLDDAERAYDAISTVWFDDLDGLQQRVDWFGANGIGQPDELFGSTSFLLVREEVLPVS